MNRMVEAVKKLIVVVGETFPDKDKIPNAYSLPDNAEGLLKNGWGIMIGAEGDSDNDEFCSMSVQRLITIVFTREFWATESDDEVPDDIGLLLLEDVSKAQLVINAPNRMNIDEIDKVELAGSSEVATVLSGKRKFLTMNASFTLTVSEKY